MIRWNGFTARQYLQPKKVINYNVLVISDTKVSTVIQYIGVIKQIRNRELRDLPKSTIYNMHVLDALEKIEDESVDCIVTSPPYLWLRDYGEETKIKWSDGWEGELGLEPNPKLYLDHLLQITKELKRVLKKSGTLWWNMGDSYSGSGNGYGGKGDPKLPKGRTGTIKPMKQTDITRKSLMQIPHRFGIRMTDEQQWILRNIIIWNKPNAMPTPVDDRFSNDFEYLYFFVKNQKYYFKQQFEPYLTPLNRWGGETLKAEGQSTWDKGTNQTTYRTRKLRPNEEGRNKRAVWEISTEAYPGAHFACYPTELVKECLKAGCPDNGIVLDPFAGSGTTLQVAREMGFDNIGIEINDKYVEIIKKRIKANEWLDRKEFKLYGKA